MSTRPPETRSGCCFDKHYPDIHALRPGTFTHSPPTSDLGKEIGPLRTARLAAADGATP